VSLYIIQTGGNKSKRKRQNVGKNFMIFCEIGTLLSIILSKVCQILHRYKFDKKIATFFQAFVNLLFLALCCWKIWQTFVKSQKEIANEKNWQNVFKRLWILFQQFVDDVQLLSVFCEGGNIQDVKQLSPKSGDIYHE